MNLLNGIEKLNQQSKGKALSFWQSHAQTQLSTMVLPNRKQENWKYTNLEQLAKTNWQSVEVSPSEKVQSEYRASCRPEFDTLSFVNGILQNPTNPGVSVKTLSDLNSSELSEIMENATATEFFQALNQAWAGQGFLLEVADDQLPKKPLCVDFYYSSDPAISLAAHPRIMIKIGKRSKMSLLIRVFGQGQYFSNLVTKIQLADSSALELVVFQENSSVSHSFVNSQVRLAANAHLRSFNFSLQGLLNRETLEVLHQGELSNSNCTGFYFTNGRSQSDHYTNIEHQVGHCHSQQLYKGLLSEDSKAVFNGRVFIAHGAEKANSEQLNKNLLLSSSAEVDSKPQLEILADDVKATHGSTVGQLDDEEIFYLQSRGIPRALAVKLLAKGFAFEIANQIESAAIKKLVFNSLAGKLETLEVL